MTFWDKLDWASPYTYLGILGALGAPNVVIQALRLIRAFWNTTLLSIRHRAVLTDFYYKQRDFGYRILEDGASYLHVRRETIVSMVKSLESATVHYRWTGRGAITERVEPTSFRIVDGTAIIGKTGKRKVINFEKPLGKRKELTYTLILACRADEEPPEQFISSTSSRRVDRLILRLAFPVSQRPQNVTFRILDADGVEKARSALECCDHLTGEYRHEISYPKPFYEHRIEWE